MSGPMEIAANGTLFLSSLLLLIDVAPHDFFPAHRRRVKAVKLLRESRNILMKFPANQRIEKENLNMSLIEDSASYAVLADFIRRRSALARDIDWKRAIGVGYAIQSLPLGAAKLEAFRPLYIVSIPEGEESQLNLIPVGQLEELDAWLSQQRRGAITKLALIFLVGGFFLQLLSSLK